MSRSLWAGSKRGNINIEIGENSLQRDSPQVLPYARSWRDGVNTVSTWRAYGFLPCFKLASPHMHNIPWNGRQTPPDGLSTPPDELPPDRIRIQDNI